MGSKFTHNALAAGAPLPTPLGELKRSPRPDFRGPLRGRGKGKEGKREEGKGKGILGKGNRKRREEEREGKGKEEGTGGEGKLASLALGGIDAPGASTKRRIPHIQKVSKLEMFSAGSKTAKLKAVLRVNLNGDKNCRLWKHVFLGRLMRRVI